jgi:hypothetical protein
MSSENGFAEVSDCRRSGARGLLDVTRPRPHPTSPHLRVRSRRIARG